MADISAESVGARLLAEVQEESLDMILREIQSQAQDQFQSVLGHPFLDQVLWAFNISLHKHTSRRPDWGTLLYPVSENDPNQGTVSTSTSSHGKSSSSSRLRSAIVQLTSSRAPAGKSNLLYYLTSLSILPPSFGGNNSTVVWLDTDGRFSSLRFHKVLKSYLAKSDSTISTKKVADIASVALQHVHVFSIQSSTKLVEILAALPNYLFDFQAHNSGSRRLGLVILDSATAFYWQDRFDADIARLSDPETVERSNSRTSRTAEIIRSLHSLQTQFDCAILLTTNSDLGGGGMKRSLDNPAQHQNPPRPKEQTAINPWSAFATVSLVLSRVSVPKFASTMTLEESGQDQQKRFEAVAKGRFVANLDWSNSDSWGHDVQESVAKMHGRGAFSFAITAEGVEMI